MRTRQLTDRAPLSLTSTRCCSCSIPAQPSPVQSALPPVHRRTFRASASGHPLQHTLHRLRVTGIPAEPALPLYTRLPLRARFRPRSRPTPPPTVAMGNSKSKSKKEAPAASVSASSSGASSSAPAESPSGIRESLSHDVDPAAAPLADGTEFAPAAGAPELLETQESAISFWDKGKVRKGEREREAAATEGACPCDASLSPARCAHRLSLCDCCWPASVPSPSRQTFRPQRVVPDQAAKVRPGG